MALLALGFAFKVSPRRKAFVLILREGNKRKWLKQPDDVFSPLFFNVFILNPFGVEVDFISAAFAFASMRGQEQTAMVDVPLFSLPQHPLETCSRRVHSSRDFYLRVVQS